MSDKWPSLYEQLGAVLAAPIPFFLAVVAVAVVVWRGGEWLYRSVLNKRKELYGLSRNEVEHWKNNAELTAKKLTETVDQLEKQENLTEETKRDLGIARGGLAELKTQLDRLGQANNSATVVSTNYAERLVGFLSPGSSSRSAPKYDWTSSGWQPRNPTDITGRSG
jgi:hypothetical protein